jgi:E3 ubiquitin-protein ligase synoviolin
MPKMRLGWYAGVSTALAGSVVLSAFLQRPNFYSAMVYLAQSNFCLIVCAIENLFAIVR